MSQMTGKVIILTWVTHLASYTQFCNAHNVGQPAESEAILSVGRYFCRALQTLPSKVNTMLEASLIFMYKARGSIGIRLKWVISILRFNRKLPISCCQTYHMYPRNTNWRNVACSVVKQCIFVIVIKNCTQFYILQLHKISNSMHVVCYCGVS